MIAKSITVPLVSYQPVDFQKVFTVFPIIQSSSIESLMLRYHVMDTTTSAQQRDGNQSDQSAFTLIQAQRG